MDLESQTEISTATLNERGLRKLPESVLQAFLAKTQKACGENSEQLYISELIVAELLVRRKWYESSKAMMSYVGKKARAGETVGVEDGRFVTDKPHIADNYYIDRDMMAVYEPDVKD